MTKSRSCKIVVAVLAGSLLLACNDKKSPESTVSIDSPVITKAGKSGYSSSSGVLTPYAAPNEVIDGAGKKLFAIYMVGSDLEDQNRKENSGWGAGSLDFEELVAGYNKLSDEEVNSVDVIVAFGGSLNWPGMRIASMQQILEDYTPDKIMGNMESEKYLYDAPDAHMGDKSSLELFLTFIKDRYTGHEFTFLDMWDHGSAYGAFGNDSNFNGDGLSMQETDSALTAAGLSFDAIGYDACLNANFELSSVIKKHANYLIASAETEPGHGWDYEDVIQSYVRSEDFIAFSTDIIDNFVNNPDHKQDGKTLSVVDLGLYDNLSAAVDVMAIEVNNNLHDKKLKDLILQLHNPYDSSKNLEGYGKSKGKPATTYDLTSLAQIVYSNSEGSLSKSAERVLNVLQDYIVYANSDSTKPNAHGVTIAPMVDGGVLKRSQIPSDSFWTLVDNIYQNFSKSDSVSPKIMVARKSKKPTLSAKMPRRKYQQKDTGTSATIIDENLKKVTTLYGNILMDKEGNRTFASVAELRTFKTEKENEYFTPTWNQKWFLVKYGVGEFDSSPLFLSFTRSYKDKDDGKEYVVYSAEVDFVNPTKDYSESDQKYDWARLDLTVDENEKVVSTSIHPYKVHYQSEEDETGHVVFDKYGKPLAINDQIRMVSYNLNLDSGESYWSEESDFLTMSIDPLFQFETLEFEDENGIPLDYYYMMMAEDLAGNISTTNVVNTAK